MSLLAGLAIFGFLIASLASVMTALNLRRLPRTPSGDASAVVDDEQLIKHLETNFNISMLGDYSFDVELIFRCWKEHISMLVRLEFLQHRNFNIETFDVEILNFDVEISVPTSKL